MHDSTYFNTQYSAVVSHMLRQDTALHVHMSLGNCLRNPGVLIHWPNVCKCDGSAECVFMESILIRLPGLLGPSTLNSGILMGLIALFFAPNIYLFFKGVETDRNGKIFFPPVESSGHTVLSVNTKENNDPSDQWESKLLEGFSGVCHNKTLHSSLDLKSWGHTQTC